ncbi:MAG: MoaD/ThiS family protein [Phycisphaerae bacterium]
MPDSVRVLAFGSAGDALGAAARDVPLPETPTLARLVAELVRQFPKLADALPRLRFAVNQRYAGDETPLRAGDEVAIIPPVAGG